MTPGTGGLDMMSPVIGLYYSFQHDKIFPRFILNKMFFTKVFMELLPINRVSNSLLFIQLYLPLMCIFL